MGPQRSVLSLLLSVSAGALLFLVAPGIARAQTATTTALQQTSNCLTSGCVTTLTATVTASQKPVPIGIVYICQGAAESCESQVPLGVFQLPASGPLTVKVQLAGGTHTLYALYRGTKAYARSRSVPQTLTITPETATGATGKATITSILSSGSPDGYTLLSNVSALQTPPTGTISFRDASDQNALVTTAPLVAGRSTLAYAAGGLDFSKVQPGSLAGATSAISGDFNNDGYQDILIGGILLLGNGKGGFTPAPVPAGIPAPPANTVDFNDDGIPDQAYIDFLNPSGQAVYVNLGVGDGSFMPALQSPLYTFEDDLDSLIIADFRNNGNQDLAFRDNYDGAYTLYSGNGDGTFVNGAFGGGGGVQGGGSAYFASDFDGDGILDILVVGSGGYLFHGAGGTFTYGSTLTLYHGNGDLTFTARPTQTIVPQGDALTNFTTGDLNGDGILDALATFTTPGGTQILQPFFYNAQQATFEPGSTVSLSQGALYTFADFNGDGLADFASFGPFPASGPAPAPAGYTAQVISAASATSRSGIVLPGATTHNIVASYSGDSHHNPSNSAALPLLGAANAFPAGIAGQPGLVLNGAAVLKDTAIQLTDGRQFEAGSFFSQNRLPVSTFSTDFDFQLTNATADGFAFVLQDNGPDAIGSSGAGVGYGNSPDQSGPGITNSVAIAFDLHNNQGEGDNSIRLEYRGVTRANAAGGDDSTAIDLTPSGIDLHSGHRFHTTIAYDGRVHITITDLVTSAIFDGYLPGNNANLSGANFSKYLDGSMAYVGFTGGTGAGTAVQTIYYWTFTPAIAPSPGSGLPYFPNGFLNGGSLGYNRGATYSGTAIDLTHGMYFANPTVFDGIPVNGYTPKSNTPYANHIFYTDFDFQIANGIGDGFTFLIQNQGYNPHGSAGGGLGYGLATPNGGGFYIPDSLAIKFDLHNNAGEGDNSTGVYVNGASPTIPSVDISPSGLNLHSGHVFHAHIASGMSGAFNQIRLTITDLTQYKVFSTNFNVSPSALPATGFAGFTAGTGATPSSIQILNWTWTEQ